MALAALVAAEEEAKEAKFSPFEFASQYEYSPYPYGRYVAQQYYPYSFGQQQYYPYSYFGQQQYPFAAYNRPSKFASVQAFTQRPSATAAFQPYAGYHQYASFNPYEYAFGRRNIHFL